MKIKSVALFLFWTMILAGENSVAANGWYWGKVTKIITSKNDGSFIIYIDNPTLQSTCAYARVVFDVTDMGQERTKAALSMALAAQASDKDWGVVVDLPSQGSQCRAAASTSQGAGIRN